MEMGAPAGDTPDSPHDLMRQYEKLDPYPGWSAVRELATSRLPYALFGPTIITHFPLFRVSEEDANFVACENAISAFIDSHREQTIGPPPVPKCAEVLDGAARERAIEIIWAQCHQALTTTLKTRPELFVFRAETLINLEINRLTHKAIVDQQIKPKDTPWENVEVAGLAFDITNALLTKFLAGTRTLVARSFETLQGTGGVAKESPPTVATDSGPAEDTKGAERDIQAAKRLGGFISWFEATAKLDRWIEGASVENRKHFGLRDEAPAPARIGDGYEIDSYLAWRRGDRNWRYTFFEGSSAYGRPDDINAQPTLLGDLKSFLRKLFQSRDLSASFPQLSKEADRHSGRSKYPFPGERAAGAQYFLIPAELLLLIGKNMAPLTKEYLGPTAEVATPIQRKITDVIAAIAKIDRSLLAGRKEDSPLGDLLEDRPLLPVESGLVEHLGRLRARIGACHEKMTSALDDMTDRERVDGRKFFENFILLAEMIWRVIYRMEKPRLGYDDFVASAVIDRRAIYFSNFRTYDESGFTRTFFIDFCLAPYQRGRLARRLCEIATHRMSCVIDFPRFAALQDGINTLSNQLNTLAARRLSARPKMEVLEASLREALQLYQSSSQLNSFITEGVIGRRRAIEADWEIVRRQVADIREARITGYALLSEFLERGLALAIVEAGIVADRYENLLARIRDHMSMLRTDLVGLQATSLDKFQGDIKDATGSLNETAKRQMQLLQSADVLVVVAGTYYLSSLWREFARHPEKEWLGIFLCFAVMIFFHWFYTGRFFFSSVRERWLAARQATTEAFAKFRFWCTGEPQGPAKGNGEKFDGGSPVAGGTDKP